MYKNVSFRLQPMEWIEEDLKELREIVPHAETIQLLSANPLIMTYEKLAEILTMINHYLPDMKMIYTQGRVSDMNNKTADELRKLRDLGMREISLGVESGDDEVLEKIEKGYRSEDILEQCRKLEEAGIDYWMTFLNGVGGKELSEQHAVRSAEIFSQLKPMVVGTGGLTLFPGTPLLEDAEKGEFTPLSEKEMLEELRLFVDGLECDCAFITHHTVAANLTGPHFLQRKKQILAALDHAAEYGDMDRLAALRRQKRTL